MSLDFGYYCASRFSHVGLFFFPFLFRQPMIPSDLGEADPLSAPLLTMNFLFSHAAFIFVLVKVMGGAFDALVNKHFFRPPRSRGHWPPSLPRMLPFCFCLFSDVPRLGRLPPWLRKDTPVLTTVTFSRSISPGSATPKPCRIRGFYFFGLFRSAACAFTSSRAIPAGPPPK